MNPQSNHDTNKDLSQAVRTILGNNSVKIGSKLARSIECSFLQGYIYARPEYIQSNPFLLICLESGRSLLDEYPVLN